MSKLIKILVAFLLASIVYWWAPISVPAEANATLAVALFMVCLWVSNAIGFGFTSLIPIVVFPLFNISTWSDLAASYLNRLVFLFLGGFLLARAMQKWHLHKRVALHVVLFFGTSPKRLIFGFMLSSAFLSMWLSNTATTILMLPIGLSIIHFLKKQHSSSYDNTFSTLMMLSIAYSASIGGMATIIGTPPNALLVAYLAEHYGIDIHFISWLGYALPLVSVAIVLSFLVLTKLVFPLKSISSDNSSGRVIRRELLALGHLKTSEFKILVVFCLVVSSWVGQPILNKAHPIFTDAMIALLGVLFLLLLKGENNQRLLEWKDFFKISWQVLFLIGGGLALASAVRTSGLAHYLAESLLVAKHLSFPTFLMLTLLLIMSLSELSSNTATTAAFIPIIANLAEQLHYPVMTLVFPATLAASCAFMLPIATAPNAIVFSSGYVTTLQMIKAGFWLNLLLALLLFVYGYLFYLFN